MNRVVDTGVVPSKAPQHLAVGRVYDGVSLQLRDVTLPQAQARIQWAAGQSTGLDDTPLLRFAAQ